MLGQYLLHTFLTVGTPAVNTMFVLAAVLVTWLITSWVRNAEWNKRIKDHLPQIWRDERERLIRERDDAVAELARVGAKYNSLSVQDAQVRAILGMQREEPEQRFRQLRAQR
jgi:hypothetical protein